MKKIIALTVLSASFFAYSADSQQLTKTTQAAEIDTSFFRKHILGGINAFSEFLHDGEGPEGDIFDIERQIKDLDPTLEAVAGILPLFCDTAPTIKIVDECRAAIQEDPGSAQTEFQKMTSKLKKEFERQKKLSQAEPDEVAKSKLVAYDIFTDIFIERAIANHFLCLELYTDAIKEAAEEGKLNPLLLKEPHMIRNGMEVAKGVPFGNKSFFGNKTDNTVFGKLKVFDIFMDAFFKRGLNAQQAFQVFRGLLLNGDDEKQEEAVGEESQ